MPLLTGNRLRSTDSEVMKVKRPYAYIGIVFLVFVLFTSLAFAYERTILGVTFQFNIWSGNVITEDGTHVRYTPNCIDCGLPMEITFDKSFSLPREKVAYRIEKLIGNIDMESVGVKLLRNRTDTVYYPTTSCNPFSIEHINGSIEYVSNCSSSVGSSEETVWFLRNVPDPINVEAGETYIIYFWGKFNAKSVFGNPSKVDLIPKVYDTELPELAVWSTNWSYYIPYMVYATNGDSNPYQIEVQLNTTYLIDSGYLRSDCGDLRFIKANTTELEWFNVTECNGDTLTIIYFLAPTLEAGYEQYDIFLGNPSATYTPDLDDIDSGFAEPCTSPIWLSTWTANLQGGSGSHVYNLSGGACFINIDSVNAGHWYSFYKAGTFNPPYIIESWFKAVEQSGDAGELQGLVIDQPTTLEGGLANYDGTTDDIHVYYSGGHTDTGYNYVDSTWIYYIDRNYGTSQNILVYNADMQLQINYTKSSVSNTSSDSFLIGTFGGGGTTAVDVYYKNILERRLVATEPVCTLGSIQYTDTSITITVASPTNTTYEYTTGGNNISIDYTISSPVGIDTCWVINASGSNLTLDCANSTMKLDIGYYTGFQVWGKNTLGELGSRYINFSVADTTTPTVSLDFPTNTTYDLDPAGVNLSVLYACSDQAGISDSWLINSSGSNITLSGQNTSIFVGSGLHTIKVICEDGHGLYGDDSVSFTIRDITDPNLTIVSPVNTTYIIAPLVWLASDNGTGIDNVHYSLNGGSWTAITTNLSSIGSLGFNTLSVMANDTEGNSVTEAVNFTLESSGLELRVYDEISEDQLSYVNLTLSNDTSSITYNNIFISNLSDDFDGTYAYTGVLAYDYNLTINDLKGVEGNVSLYFTCAIGFGDHGAISIYKNDVNVSFWDQECEAGGTAGSLITDEKFTYGDRITIYVSGSDNHNVVISASTINTTEDEPTVYFREYSDLTNGESTITLDKEGYSTRKYYATFSNTTREEIDGYLIPISSGIWVRWHIKTFQDQNIIGALTQATRLLDDGYALIEEALSDDSGTATMFLDPTATYMVNVTAIGFVTYSGSFQTSSSDYTIYMVNSSQVADFTYIFDDIYMWLLPDVYSILNQSGVTINFTILSTNSTLTYYGMNITYPNGTILFHDEDTTASGGTITGLFNATDLNETWVNATIYFLKDGYSIWTESHIYYIYASEGYGLEIFDIEIPMFAKSLVTIILALFIGISVARYNTIGSGILVMIFLGFMTFIGWFEPIIYMLLIVATFSIIVIRGRLNG